MDEPTPIHVVAPDGPARERLVRDLGVPPSRVHASCSAFQESADQEDLAAVVLDREVGVEEAWALGRRIADGALPWILLRADADEGGGIVFRSFSVGFPETPASLSSRTARPGQEGPVLDLHEALRFVSRVRHDINNPLTAGLAETQLLLMDVGEDGEVRQALETIQRQLRRIQEMVRDDLTRLRRPR